METSTRFDFQVIALPRSGTLWMANFLSYGDYSLCIHEPEGVDYPEPVYCSEGLIPRYTRLGASSSALVISGTYRPEIPTIRINRAFLDAWESYKRFTNLVTQKQLSDIHDQIYAIKGDMVMDVSYKNLTSRDTCEKIWRFLDFPAVFPDLHHSEKARMRITTMDTAMDTIKLHPRELAWARQ